jgi:serine phosphatase RsbU (regulator of sigma subunit)
MLGFDATAAAEAACRSGASATDVVEQLLSVAKAFAGQDPPHSDDMTCVVVRVDED